jgi:predicted acetyltransferase
MQLVRPSNTQLDSYVCALRRGWSPDNTRGAVAAEEQLARIALDAPAFLAALDDREAKGPPVTLPDGSEMRRLPGFVRWIWDGEFCGSIGFRWQPGSAALPAHVLGHIGYAVVPWKRGRGHATAAVRQLLPEARALGLPFVEITTEPDNLASQRVIENAGGVLFEHYTQPAAFGGKPGLRFRITI